MPTARNAKGIDILIYSQDAERKFTVQVKALSKSSPVPLGGKLTNLFGDFFVVCRKLETPSPECFILKPDEVKKLAHEGKSPKDEKLSYWLQQKAYAVETFREKWERIGHGNK
jgi:hypothetical protein